MNYQPETDDRLLRNLLLTSGANRQPPAPEHEHAEELFELFLEGKLQGEDLEEFTAYLDANPKARAAASRYLEFLEEQPLEELPGQPHAMSREAAGGWWTHAAKSVLGYAIAACVLISLGLVYWNIGNAELAENDVYSQAELLVHQSQFDAALELIEEANHSGVDSTRLQLLAARGAMHQALPLEDASAWSLHAMGYGYDGAIAMDAPAEEGAGDLTKANDLLNQADAADDRARLAKGWLLLKEYQAQDARAVFDALLQEGKQTDAALLGRASASFILGGGAFNDAARDYRAYLQGHPEDNTARINLAMSLAAADQPQQALAEWKQVDLNKLPKHARSEAEVAIEDLQSLLGSEEAQP
ncbi:MAG: hypothetical protein KDA37_10225 [Planctomycetales bacterium]|nr:hypothetical protein [Planctomycetales bacterium]